MFRHNVGMIKRLKSSSYKETAFFAIIIIIIDIDTVLCL
jgi:hypothetical protein